MAITVIILLVKELNQAISQTTTSHCLFGGHRGRECIVIGFTTTYAVSAYHN